MQTYEKKYRFRAGTPARAALLAVAFAALLGGTASPARAAELYLVDEREIYLAIYKLNAMGALPGFLANTRPYDLKAVRAALDNNPLLFEDAGFDSRLAQWVAFYAKDTVVARGTASLAWSRNGTDPAT